MTQLALRARLPTEEERAILPCDLCPVRAHGVCSAVARPVLNRLATLATIVDIPRGQMFIHEGAQAKHLYVLIAGAAKLYKLLPDGRCQIVGFDFAGSLLGLAALEDYTFSAEAITPLRICRISRKGLSDLLRDCREMEQRLLRFAVGDLIRAQEQILLLGRKTAIERIASFLFLQLTRPQPRAMRPPRIYLPMSRTDIASYLGMSIETVSRTLAKLKNRGLIAVPNVREIDVLDRSRLKALAHGATHLHSITARRADSEQSSRLRETSAYVRDSGCLAQGRRENFSL
jgi:CRP/FNR family transcriptional regulator